MSDIERLSETYCDDCNGDYVLYEDHLAEAEAITKAMNAKVKKAFCWSAEFTQVVHGKRIHLAWNDHNEIISKSGESKL